MARCVPWPANRLLEIGEIGIGDIQPLRQHLGDQECLCPLLSEGNEATILEFEDDGVGEGLARFEALDCNS